ncbi:MAG: hypothetical protein ACM3S1_08875 [Hyphomicrobiales bacterium]
METAVRICFDVDDTLIDFDRRIRPFAREVFEELHRCGFQLFVWSGVGVRWEVVEVHGLKPFVAGVHWKPVSRHRERLAEYGIPFVPDFVVDDDIEVVEAFGGFHIPQPEFDLISDRHLLDAYAAIVEAFPHLTPAGAEPAS